MQEKEDKELILETLKGKLSAYEGIVKKYQEMIYRHTYKILNNPDNAEDATQETFIRAYQNLSKFKLDKPLKPWLYKIATNLCYDTIRKNSRLTQLNWDVETESPPILEELVLNEERANVTTSLRKLSKKYRIPIVDFYFNNLSYKAIAIKLKLPVNTVRTRLKRGKKLLKEEIIS